ncbi:MAG TPA: CbiX/SirB N-terminal domain-containing protein [Ramlibacter sp.]|nr:CbiX/SirB N-terminal domain-containing protein [Ramlibacter sp.]
MTRAIVLFGHGSRDPHWREPMDDVARRIRAGGAQVEVRCAFLDLEQPDLATAITELVEAGVDSIRVVPMFLGVGKHAREDLPRVVERCRKAHPTTPIELQPSVGENPRLLDLLAGIAIE